MATVWVTGPRATGCVLSPAFAGCAFPRDATTAPPARTATSATPNRRPGHVARIPLITVICGTLLLARSVRMLRSACLRSVWVSESSRNDGPSCVGAREHHRELTDVWQLPRTIVIAFP